jgi:tetratricopeptide (TPR) repeat protein
MAVIHTIGQAWRAVALVAVALLAAQPLEAQKRGPEYTQCAAQTTPPDQKITACSAIIQANRDPANVIGLAYLGRAGGYAAKADFDRALVDAEEAIRRLPTTGLAYVFRGFVLANKGQNERAFTDYNKAVSLEPKLVLAYVNRAQLLFNTGQYDAAISDYTKLIQLDAKDAAAYYFARGACWHFKRDFDRAIAEYDQAIKSNAQMMMAYVGRSNAYTHKGQYDRGLADGEQAVKLDPNSAYPYANRGEAYRNMGDLDHAIADFDQSIKLDPTITTVYVFRGLAHEAKGDIARAREDYTTAVSLPPKEFFEARELQARARGHLVALAAAPGTPEQAAPARIATAPSALSPPRDAASAVASDAFKHKVALVVGNGTYRFANQLPNPPNDASDVAQLLRRMGFDVVAGNNLDYNAMKDAIRSFGRKLDSADLALFFYAGHGLQVSGANYLVPIDAKLERAADLNFEAIDVNLVLQQMEAEKRVNLIFLDACRDNPLSRSLARSLGTRSTAVNSGLASIQSGVGTMISFATRPDTVALDGEGRNSPFTTALLKHLPTPNLDIGLVMRRVRADVLAATHDRQEPWDNSSLVGEVILAR